jgi:hypothetical protein
MESQEEYIKEKLKNKPIELINEARKVVTPATIMKVYEALCPQCKAKAIHRREDFCEKCMKKIEVMIIDSYN